MRWISLLLYSAATALLSAQAPASLQLQASNTTASLRGIASVGAGVAWASGTHGTVLRTEDGGYLWQTCTTPPGAETLDFRAIQAWDAQTAIVMSSGPGDKSRLYKTTDGCATWTLLATNSDPEGFWDALRFWDKTHATILGDPVGGAFVLLDSSDGGRTWQRQHIPGLTADPARAGAFAASNTSLTSIPGNSNLRFFATGGTSGAFVYTLRQRLFADRNFEQNDAQLHTSRRWQAVSVPLTSGNASSGVFSVAFRDSLHGLAAGGDYQQPNSSTGTMAWTADGGQHWTAATRSPHGYRSAVAWDAASAAWITAGTNGSDISYDDGRTWQPLENGNWNAIALPWLVGPAGRIGKLVSLKKAPSQPGN